MVTPVQVFPVHVFGENSRLLEAFVMRDVDFIVVGGVALKAWRPERREPEDLDLLIDRSEANVERVLDALTPLMHAENEEPSFSARDIVDAASVAILDLKVGYLHADLIVPPPGFGFAAAFADCVLGSVNDYPVRIASPHLMMEMRGFFAETPAGVMEMDREDLELLTGLTSGPAP